MILEEGGRTDGWSGAPIKGLATGQMAVLPPYDKKSALKSSEALDLTRQKDESATL